MARRIGLLLIFVLAAFWNAYAQEGSGQLWVSAFEDRNGNGQRDGGEPLITRGVSINLLNSDSVIIDSALLDDSPNAARGLVGFQRLAPGTYTVTVTTPDLTPTTPDVFTQTIEAGGLPVVLNFGGQRVAAEVTASGESVSGTENDLARVAVAALGALVVMGVLTLLGGLIYVLILRRRLAERPRVTATGTIRPLDTDSFNSVEDARDAGKR
jgi:hypothetical protein